MTTDVSVFAPAKINLSLHVTGQRADGYHVLDSLVAFADVGDRIKLQPAKGIALHVTGPFAHGVPAGPENLCWKAARIMGGDVSISLDKHLPAAAGLGGGSADAAAVLRAMQRMTGHSLPADFGLSLGADVPACVGSTSVRMSGVGEILEPATIPPLAAVLVNPGVSISTKDVFAHLPGKANPSMSDRGETPFVEWVSRQRNDLQHAACDMAPVVADVLGALLGAGASLARMSGSGATCFGLFQNQLIADAAAQQIREANPTWWVVSTRLGAAQSATA